MAVLSNRGVRPWTINTFHARPIYFMHMYAIKADAWTEHAPLDHSSAVVVNVTSAATSGEWRLRPPFLFHRTGRRRAATSGEWRLRPPFLFHRTGRRRLSNIGKC